jgi:hypothetical protein
MFYAENFLHTLEIWLGFTSNLNLNLNLNLGLLGFILKIIWIKIFQPFL